MRKIWGSLWYTKVLTLTWSWTLWDSKLVNFFRLARLHEVCGSANVMQSLVAPVYHWWEWLISSLLLFVVRRFVWLLWILMYFFLFFACCFYDERDDNYRWICWMGTRCSKHHRCRGNTPGENRPSQQRPVKEGYIFVDPVISPPLKPTFFPRLEVRHMVLKRPKHITHRLSFQNRNMNKKHLFCKEGCNKCFVCFGSKTAQPPNAL